MNGVRLVGLIRSGTEWREECNGIPTVRSASVTRELDDEEES